MLLNLVTRVFTIRWLGNVLVSAFSQKPKRSRKSIQKSAFEWKMFIRIFLDGSHEESEITTKICCRMLPSVTWNIQAYQRSFITIHEPWVFHKDFRYAFKSKCALPIAEVKGFFHVFNNFGFIVDWKYMNFHPFHLINKKRDDQQAKYYDKD